MAPSTSKHIKHLKHLKHSLVAYMALALASRWRCIVCQCGAAHVARRLLGADCEIAARCLGQTGDVLKPACICASLTSVEVVHRIAWGQGCRARSGASSVLG